MFIVRAKRRIDQGLGDMFMNVLKYPHVFSRINTNYPKVGDDAQQQIMELATHPMGDQEAQKILELLC